MRQAERLGAPWVVIIGPEEWKRDAAAVRDMRRRDQDEVSLSHLRQELVRRAA
jgi:histidyl-tRNA synthetase